MNPIRKVAIGAALAGSTLLGGAFGAAIVNTSASAQTSSSTTATTPPASTAPYDAGSGSGPAHDPTTGGHVANGITEAVLTGDAATKATTAAQAAVPDGTIDRVENDAEGAAYEAHVTKADGTRVTVKMDSSFAVTGIENGPMH